MKTITLLLLSFFAMGQSYNGTRISPNNCVSFTVTAGTGCAWMCSYCANQLGTNNYYFPDSVCAYGPGGCAGYPIAGQLYTCCSA
jgi:hypothetical protein